MLELDNACVQQIKVLLRSFGCGSKICSGIFTCAGNANVHTWNYKYTHM